jgi:uncharacterized tellurite resistance protein B-like protein
MIQSLLQRLLAPQPARLPEPDARLALATLMVRLARTDGEYSADEVARIDRVLGECYSLSPFEASDLRGKAEVFEAEAPDTVRFTRAIKAATDHEDRLVLVQALWSVALADGARDADEDQLMRLVTSLLGVTDVESGLACQRAARK